MKKLLFIPLFLISLYSSSQTVRSKSFLQTKFAPAYVVKAVDMDDLVESIPSIAIKAWATSTAYVVDDYVTQSNILYKCLTAHTAGTFATDLAAVKWVAIGSPPAAPVYALTSSTSNQSSYTITKSNDYDITSNQAAVAIVLGGGTAATLTYASFSYQNTVSAPVLTITTTNTALTVFVDGVLVTSPVTLAASTTSRYKCFVTYQSTAWTDINCVKLKN